MNLGKVHIACSRSATGIVAFHWKQTSETGNLDDLCDSRVWVAQEKTTASASHHPRSRDKVSKPHRCKEGDAGHINAQSALAPGERGEWQGNYLCAG